MPHYINFVANINPQSAISLINAVTTAVNEGATEIVILLSSSGGFVAPGLSIHEFLKGLPVKLTVHGYGSIHSIAVPILCAATRRLATPNTQFLIHGVNLRSSGAIDWSLQLTQEKLNSVTHDQQRIASIIAASSTKEGAEIEEMMLKGTTLGAADAKGIGLINDVEPDLFPAGTTVQLIASAT